MLRPLAPLVIALVSLAPAVACAVSASTQAGTGSPADGSSGGGAGKPAQAAPGTTPGPADPSAAPGGVAAAGAGLSAGPQACVAALADNPVALFGTRVLIRLPKGVELVQQNPFYAQAAAAQQATSCGAPVQFSAVGYFVWPANANLTQVRDQLLELRGIALDSVTWSEEGSRGRHYTGAYTVSQDPKTRGWLVLRDAPGDKFAYFAMFETDEASWDGLRAVFQDAGRSLLVKPRAIQGPEQVAPPTKTEEPPPEPTKKKKKKKAA